jgi:hypothetical protein
MMVVRTEKHVKNTQKLTAKQETPAADIPLKELIDWGMTKVIAKQP